MSIKTGAIILVEDDKNEQKLFTMAFEKLKVMNELIIFNNGEEALNYLLNPLHPAPFLIISDINMPKVNGIELLQEIQNDQRLKEKSIPFLFFTNSGTEEDVRKAYNLGVHGYFQKPVSFSSLKVVLEMVLQYWTSCLFPKALQEFRV